MNACIFCFTVHSIHQISIHHGINLCNFGDMQSNLNTDSNSIDIIIFSMEKTPSQKFSLQTKMKTYAESFRGKTQANVAKVLIRNVTKTKTKAFHS